MNTPDTLSILKLEVMGNHNFLVLLYSKIQQLINKTTSDLFNIKRQWASFFINHFLQHLKENKLNNKIVTYLEEIQKSKKQKQRKFNQSDVQNIMKDQTIKGDFKILFDEWLTTHAEKLIENAKKIEQQHKDIYKKLIPDIKSELEKENPFYKFMNVPQMSNQPTIQGQLSEIVSNIIDIIEENKHYQIEDQEQSQEQDSYDQQQIMELEDNLMNSSIQIDY